MQMQTRKLRDLTVSAIGYGCMGFSHGYGALPPKSEAIRLMRKAYDLGCTFFDTAEGYGAGENEELVGAALEPIRDKVVIVTKLHIRNEGDIRAQIESRLDASLKRLRTDHVDLYFQHRVNQDSQYSGDDVRRVITRFSRENVVANQPLLDMLNDFAAQKQVTPAQISLAWMLHKKSFIVPIPGMRTDARLEENLGAASVTLTAEEFQAIEAALSRITIYGNRTDEDIAKLRGID